MPNKRVFFLVRKARAFFARLFGTRLFLLAFLGHALFLLAFLGLALFWLAFLGLTFFGLALFLARPLGELSPKVTERADRYT